MITEHGYDYDYDYTKSVIDYDYSRNRPQACCLVILWGPSTTHFTDTSNAMY